jgi:glycosyltransferase involved in cell wall biosynthesis
MPICAMPLVSVVTPVYNGERYLRQCIESVRAQSYPNWKYVIVNNCSTDNSLAIATEYAGKDPRIVVLSNEQHLGAVENWNYAVGRVSSDSKYCKVLHADDWIFPDCLDRMVTAAESNPSAAIVSCYVLREKSSTDRPSPERSILNAEIPYKCCLLTGHEIGRTYFLDEHHLTFAPSSLLIRCECIRRRDLLYDASTGIYTALDLQAALEFLECGDLAFVHQVLVGARDHAESLTSQVNQHSLQYPETLRLLRRFGYSFLSDAEYDLCWKRAIFAYSSFLGRSLLASRRKGFWQFHREQLKEFGSPINFFALPGHAILEVARRVLRTTGLSKQRLPLLKGRQPVAPRSV